MPRESNLEVKVGAFVTAAVIALVAFVFSISDLSLFQKGVGYTVDFQFANGLKKGAPVRVAGVDAGHIRDLRVFYDPALQKTRVEVDVWVQDTVRVPQDSLFVINQLGLLGEKYLEIFPGTSIEVAPEGAVFKGEEPVSMEAIMKTVSGLAAKVEGTLSGLNKGVLTDKNKQALAETLQSIAIVTRNIRDGEGTVGRFLQEDVIYENLDEFTADLKANPWKLFYRPKSKK